MVFNMVRWKARKETVDIGCIGLGSLTFDEDYIGVSIDICDMSEELKEEVGRAVEAAKIEYTKQWEGWYAEHPGVKRHKIQWGGQPVVMDYTYLSVVFGAGKPVTYSIVAGFHDPEDARVEACADITVDFSGYTNELKKEVTKVLLDKFFDN
jgi:hypothetical protein